MTAVQQRSRRLVEVKEVMRYMRCSHSHVYKLIRERKITAYKDGRRTLVDLNTVDEYNGTLPPVLLQPR